jgi:hypothetical protein
MNFVLLLRFAKMKLQLIVLLFKTKKINYRQLSRVILC